MRIPYLSRSRFLAPISAALDAQDGRLSAGDHLDVMLTPQGYDGTVTVEVDRDDSGTFYAEWEGSDVTRFPVRIRAAATALRDRRAFGRYTISHENGLLRIRSA